MRDSILFPRSPIAYLSLAVFFVCSASSHAFSSACIRPTYTKIRFSRGAICWQYQGKDTHFVGEFGAGQHVIVRMSGLAFYATGAEGTGVTSKWETRYPQVTGPGGYSAGADMLSGNGVLETTLPEKGKYEFWFFPCAMWNNFGRVEICAVP